MRWNGTASQRSKTRIPHRPSIHSAIQASSSQPGQDCQPPRARPRPSSGSPGPAAGPAGSTSGATTRPVPLPVRPAAISWLGGEPITRTAHRLYELESELGPQSPDADVDHVGSRVEVDAPDRGEQLLFRYRLTGMLHQLPEHHDLKPGERYRPGAGVGPQPPEVEHELASPQYLE